MLKILKIEAYAHSHATEDERKVRKALFEIFPQELRERLIFVREELKGHYNNPIVRMRVETSSSEDALKVFNYILNRFDRADLGYLRSTLEDRVDRSGTLHIRISKQDAYLGKLVLFEGDDVVKISVHLEGRRRKVLKELSDYLKSFSREDEE